jgi:hypothetical protein
MAVDDSNTDYNTGAGIVPTGLPLYSPGYKPMGGAGSGNPETDQYLDHYRPLMSSSGLTPELVDAVRQGVSKIESGGNYRAQDEGNSNFGRYQYNLDDIHDIAKDVYGEHPPSYQQLMNDPNLQERYYAGYLQLWHDRLSQNSPAYRAADPETRAKALAASQMGWNSRGWVEGGSNFHDANGTPIGAWPNAVDSYLKNRRYGQALQVPPQPQPAIPMGALAVGT